MLQSKPFDKTKNYGLKPALGLFILFAYLLVSIASQIKYTFVPFGQVARYIPKMLAKDDLGQLQELAYPVYRIISEINQYPEDTNFYFVPGFADSQNTAVWWWYLYLLSRYLTYPRKIFCHDESLYDGKKQDYLNKFIGGAEYYSELDWVKSRNVKRIILFHNNTISILPIDTEIKI